MWNVKCLFGYMDIECYNKRLMGNVYTVCFSFNVNYTCTLSIISIYVNFRFRELQSGIGRPETLLPRWSVLWGERYISSRNGKWKCINETQGNSMVYLKEHNHLLDQSKSFVNKCFIWCSSKTILKMFEFIFVQLFPDDIHFKLQTSLQTRQ